MAGRDAAVEARSAGGRRVRVPVMSAAEVTAFLDREFPQLLSGHGRFVIESVGPMAARVRLVYDERHLRPGGTLSGPSMFGLCDVSLYIAILAQSGPVSLAVTDQSRYQFPAPAAGARSHWRVPADQARQAPRRRRGLGLSRWRGRAGRARDGHVFDAAAVRRGPSRVWHQASRLASTLSDAGRR